MGGLEIAGWPRRHFTFSRHCLVPDGWALWPVGIGYVPGFRSAGYCPKRWKHVGAHGKSRRGDLPFAGREQRRPGLLDRPRSGDALRIALLRTIAGMETGG